MHNLKKESVVSLIGGSGFLGRCLAERLVKKGLCVQIISRSATYASSIRVGAKAGQVTLKNLDATNYQDLEKVIASSDYVVNLVGIMHESSANNSFEKLHKQLPAKIAELCSKHKVKRFIHISALGIEKAVTSVYAQTKLAGQKAALAGFRHTIVLKPSVIFGPGDKFLNTFNIMLRFSPFLPLIGGNTKMQPIFVEDVADAVIAALEANEKLSGKSVELCGPKEYTMRALLETLLKVKGQRRLIVPIPFCVAKIKAYLLEAIGFPIVTVQQVEMLKYDNVSQGEDGLKLFGISARSLEFGLKRYLI